MGGRKAAAAASPAAATSAAEKMKAVRGRAGRSGALLSPWTAASVIGVASAAALGRQAMLWATAPSSYGQVLPLPRLDARRPDALSEFYERYHAKAPVLIENAIGAWPAMNWTPSSLAARCPSARLPVYAYDLKADDWAALREHGELSLAEYVAGGFGPQGGKHAKLYGLEMSLRNECPELLEDVRIPAFFADDLLVRYYKKAAWPTLIAGPQGTQSGLHVDTHNLPFWMALFVGRKRWRVFAPGEIDAFYQRDRNGFTFDPFNPDFERYPGLGAATVYDHVLEPGQLIYIPNGAPHAAFNLEDAVAISGNYLDTRSLERHLGGTCKEPLWLDSRLCWFYTEDFSRHPQPALKDLRELSFFEFAGFKDAAGWCASFLPDLGARAAKRAELERCVPIVEAYCARQK